MLIPRISSSFVGRAAETSAIARALEAGARLVTVTGPAGVGKTRLALESAAGVSGARFCALEDAVDRDGVLDVIATAFAVSPADRAGDGLPARGQGGTRGGFQRRIGDALDARGAPLVILDGVERVLDPVAAAVAAWLQESSRVRFLVASRERLGVAGERVVEVAPLSRQDATALFLARATTARPGFVATEDDGAAIAEIAAALDGLPLALELAAARVAVLSPRELAARLDRRLDVLVAPGRAGSARQRTLRRALDASWDALGPEERAGLAQLAVFRGGFAVAAAERVLDLPGDADVAGVLEALRRKSLLWGRPVGDGSSEMRLGTLESVRVYAAEKLDATGDAARLRRRHAEVLLELGRQWAARPDTDALERLARERDNLLLVLRGSAGPRHALEAVIVLEELLAARDPAEAHLALLDVALGAPGARALDAGLVARALLSRGRVAGTLGRAADAARDLSSALRLAIRAGDAALGAEIHAARGGLQYMGGRLTAARAAFETARRTARRAGTARVEAAALTGLAAVVHVQGQIDVARRLNERALVLQVAAGDRRREGRTLARLGFLHHDCGDLDAASDCYRRSLAIHRAFGAHGPEAIVLGYLGNLARRRGDLSGARGRYGEALAILRELGDRFFEPVFLMDEGIALLDHDHATEARVRLEGALTAMRRAKNRYLETLVRGYLAVALAETGAPEAARRMLAVARRRRSTGPLAVVLRLQAAHVELVAARRARGALAAARRALAAAGRQRSDHVHLAQRMLARVVERAAPPTDAWVLASDGRSFTAPGSGPVTLEARESLRRIVAALARAWRERRGAALPVEELFAAGWPGERALAAAARNRVRVALATLRGLGLRGLIATTREGYLLRPAAPVVLLAAQV